MVERRVFAASISSEAAAAPRADWLGVARWPLAGRDSEMESLERAWASESCRVLVACGPVGVGKTRLAEEFLSRVERAGWRSARVTASASASAVPLGAVAHLVPAGVDLSDPVRGFAEVARALGSSEHYDGWALLVDDLHLLDAASAVLLRQLVDSRVIRLIGTLRTGEPLSDPAVALLSGEGIHRTEVAAFGASQVDAVLQATLGAPVSRRTLHSLYTASGGNALYLHELVLGALAGRALVNDGEIWELASDWQIGTARLSELIAARLAGADPRARLVLDLLAVCQTVSLTDAEELAPLNVLTRLEEEELVHVSTDQRRTSLSLAHPLYGEVLRDRLPSLQRRALLLGQIERTRTQGARRQGDARHIAAWQLAATGSADPAMLVQAASLARYAHDYTQALSLLRALPETHHTATTRLMFGDVLFEVGDSAQAEAVLAQAYGSAADDREVVAATLARTFNLVWGSGNTGEARRLNDTARTRVTTSEALRSLRHNEGAMLLASQDIRGLALLEDLTEEIHDSDPVSWLHGATMKPIGLTLAGHSAQAMALAERAYAAHLEIDHRALYPHPAIQLISLTYALRDHGSLEEARRIGEQCYAELTVCDVPFLRIGMAINLGRTEWLAGRMVASRRWFAEAAAMARSRCSPLRLAVALAGVAACASVLGDVEAAEQALLEAQPHLSTVIPTDMECLASAWLSAAKGDLEGARTALSTYASLARSAGLSTLESLLLTDLIRLSGAAQASERLAELTQACEGRLVPARARFVAALLQNDPEHLMEVAGELSAMGAHLLSAEAATSAANIWRYAGDARRATAAGREADSSALRCEGARTPLLATAQTSAPLTPRERDIALLAARGVRSKDIAETLHLSIRTVENHLQHAYTKMGVRSRSELADAISKHALAFRRHSTGRE